MMKKFFLEHSATLMKSKQTRNFSSKSASANVIMLRGEKKNILQAPKTASKTKLSFLY